MANDHPTTDMQTYITTLMTLCSQQQQQQVEGVSSADDSQQQQQLFMLNMEIMLFFSLAGIILSCGLIVLLEISMRDINRLLPFLSSPHHDNGNGHRVGGDGDAGGHRLPDSKEVQEEEEEVVVFYDAAAAAAADEELGRHHDDNVVVNDDDDDDDANDITAAEPQEEINA